MQVLSSYQPMDSGRVVDERFMLSSAGMIEKEFILADKHLASYYTQLKKLLNEALSTYFHSILSLLLFVFSSFSIGF